MADCKGDPNPTAALILKVNTTVYIIEPPVMMPTTWAYPTGKVS